MAGVVSILGTATFNTTSGTKTVTATPAVGDLIVIVTAHTGNTSTTAPTDNNSGGGGTYTLVNTAVKATSADTMKMWVRNALITSATSTVFTHAPGTTTGGGLVVMDVQGMEKVGSAAVVQSAIQSNQAAGTPAPVFGATPGIDHPIIGAVFNASNPATLTPRSGYSEIADVGYNTPASGLEVMADNAGEASATITWGSSSGSAFCSIVVEINDNITHATTGTLSGNVTTVVGSAVHSALHATTGTLTGSGSTIVGSSVHNIPHPTTGVLSGGSASIVGSADRQSGIVDHVTTGALSAGNAIIVGSASRTHVFSSTGVLSAGNASVSGSADRQHDHPTTGVLSAGNATIVGSASRTHVFSTNGVLNGSTATVSGAAARSHDHPTTGVLGGQTATVVGGATRTHEHFASGTLSGQVAQVVGNASIISVHYSTGQIIGGNAVVSGAASAVRVHETAGQIISGTSYISGSAFRVRYFSSDGVMTGGGSTVNGSTVKNNTLSSSGDLVGAYSSVSGQAYLLSPSTISGEDVMKLTAIWQRLGLDANNPLTENDSSAVFGNIMLTKTGDNVVVTVRSGEDYVLGNATTMIHELWQRLGLDANNQLSVSDTQISAGSVEQTRTTVSQNNVIITRV